MSPLTFSAYSEAICCISADCIPTMEPTALAVSLPYMQKQYNYLPFVKWVKMSLDQDDHPSVTFF